MRSFELKKKTSVSFLVSSRNVNFPGNCSGLNNTTEHREDC